MGTQEGIDLLIDAIDLIVHQHGRTDIQFVLVGGGPSLAALKQLAEDKQVSPFLTFTGRAPDAVLFEVLSTMDLGVNPDRVNAMNDKSTMNKIMEYMAMGKAMVQFDVKEGRFSAQDASLYAKANDPVDLAEQIDRKQWGFMGDAAGYAYLSLQQAIAQAGLSETQASNPLPW